MHEGQQVRKDPEMHTVFLCYRKSKSLLFFSFFFKQFILPFWGRRSYSSAQAALFFCYYHVSGLRAACHPALRERVTMEKVASCVEVIHFPFPHWAHGNVCVRFPFAALTAEVSGNYSSQHAPLLMLLSSIPINLQRILFITGICLIQTTHFYTW